MEYRKFFKFKYQLSQKGQSLIELLMTIGLMALFLPALITVAVSSRESRAQEGQRLTAALLLKESNEAVRSVREKGWNAFSVNGTYHPAISGSAWSLVGGSESISGGFTRSVVISDVQRNSSGAIVTSGGTVDNSTKKVVSTISWTAPYSSSISSTSYLQRHLSNVSWDQTTQADFNGGTRDDTTVTNNSGGEVQIASTLGGNWALPTTYGSYNNTGNADANDVFVLGNFAYLGLDDGGTDPDFDIINVSTPTSPTLTGSLNFGAHVKGVYVVGNYAYLATASNSEEFMVIDVTTKSAPVKVASIDLGANDDATSIFVSGGYAFVAKNAGSGASRELYIINVTTPTSPSVTGSYESGVNVNSVFVSGNFAYLATDSNPQELVIVNVTNKASPTTAGSYDVTSSNSNATDVFVVGTTVYFTTLNNPGVGAEFFILNASNPASPSLVGSYNTGGNTNGVFIFNNYAMLATSIPLTRFIVLNIAVPSLPVLYGFVDPGADLNDLYVTRELAYVASTATSQELTIILGGTGLPFWTAGTFESSTFDATASVGFNNLTFSITEPASTNINFQIAVNNDNATWNYVGPDGTAATFFESPGAIPLSSNTARYIRYKAYFTGTGLVTPVLNSTGVNYSP